MRLIDIINGPWAITPAMLCEIRSIYAKHLRGEKIDKAVLEKLAAENNVRKAGDGPAYDVVNGTAIVSVDGVLSKKMNLFSAISGGVSTQLIERDIRAALDDGMVRQVVLLIDSPGGTVDGTFELANFIYENRGKKPIVTLADGSMYSAAYAIGAAAERVYISSQAAGAGSIGVVAAHEDWSKYEEKLGVKTTEIYAGKYKRAASQYAPLSEDGKKSIQDEVDYLYSVFVDTVARFRGTTAEDVLARMSTDVKSAFIGTQAIEAGLVDGVSTLDDIINNSAGAGTKPAQNKAWTGASEAEKEEVIMNLAELKTKHPDIYQAAYDEGKKAGEDAMECPEKCKEESKKEGATAELARVKSVKAVAMPGHEALIESLMFDGKTTGPEAAMQVVTAENQKRGKHLAGFMADGKNVIVPVVDGAAAEAKKKGDEQMKSEDKTLPVEERAKAAWDADVNLRSDFMSYEAFAAYYKANDAGLVKIMSKEK